MCGSSFSAASKLMCARLIVCSSCSMFQDLKHLRTCCISSNSRFAYGCVISVHMLIHLRWNSGCVYFSAWQQRRILEIWKEVAKLHLISSETITAASSPSSCFSRIFAGIAGLSRLLPEYRPFGDFQNKWQKHFLSEEKNRRLIFFWFARTSLIKVHPPPCTAVQQIMHTIPDAGQQLQAESEVTWSWSRDTGLYAPGSSESSWQLGACWAFSPNTTGPQIAPVSAGGHWLTQKRNEGVLRLNVCTQRAHFPKVSRRDDHQWKSTAVKSTRPGTFL